MGGIAKLILFLLFLTLISCQNDRPQRVNIPKKALIEMNVKIARRDSAIIVAYSDSLGLNTNPNKSGLWLTIYNDGEGEKIEKNNEVEFDYKISDIMGEVYYEGTKKIRAGKGLDISGLDEILLNLKDKNRATAILIPDKAYGILGDENKIRGRRILRYDIEIKNVEK